MRILKNRKGFTLVELLAVIVVLAVIILIASSNVGEMMVRARKNALAIEGNELINAAKTAYQMEVLDGRIKSGSACFSMAYLYKNGYYSKGSGIGEGKDGYSGSVLVTVPAGAGNTTYTFWISNGSYKIDAAATGATGTSAAASTETASANCGNTASQKFE